MQITRTGVALIIFFMLSGLAYTSFSPSLKYELPLLAFGPVVVLVFAAALMEQNKVSFLKALKMCFTFKTTPAPMCLLLILWIAIVVTDANTCHLGRDDGMWEAEKNQLEIKMMLEKRAKKAVPPQ